MKVINYIIAICLTLFIYTWFALKTLPSPDVVVAEMSQDPIQTSVDEDSFLFEYRDETYRVQPITDYEIWGMIVSHNNINAWYNYYHDKNTVNFKDVCLAWGPNLSNGVYQDTKFRSGEWTCYYEVYSQADAQKFDPTRVSNNHLLAADPKIQKTIWSMRKGDQVYISGKLINYAASNKPANMYRSTSLTRNDYGCEIIFVEEAKILKRGNQGLYIAKAIGKYGALIFFVINIIWFFVSILKKPSYIEKE